MPCNPSRRGRVSRSAGFTFIELVVVVAVVGIVATLGIPALQKLIHRSRMEGFARQTSILMSRARLESIRRGVDCVVELRDVDGGPEPDQVRAFADVDGPNVGDPPDRIYNQIGGQPVRETDYLIGVPLEIPGTIQNIAPGGEQPIEGFTDRGGGGLDRVVIFQSDGGVVDTGAYRFGDGFGNFLEIRVEPAGTGRIALRKFNADLPQNPSDDSQWFEFGEGGQAWEWN